MSRLFFSIFALLLMSGCAAVVEGQTQIIKVETPGTAHAECLLDNGTVIYKVASGHSVEVTRNDQDMKVRCLTHGNREKEILVKRRSSPWAAGDILTGAFPGALYDHFSKSMYVYPDVITVDFTGMPPVPYSLPAYEFSDAPKPAEEKIEGYRPSVPQIEEDKYDVNPVLRKRDPRTTYGADPFADEHGPVSLTR